MEEKKSHLDQIIFLFIDKCSVLHSVGLLCIMEKIKYIIYIYSGLFYLIFSFIFYK